LAALTCAVSAPVSAAASDEPCAKQVFLDWWDNYRIDRIYPLHCYRDAIDALPVDIRQYSRAEEDIRRALAYALQRKPDPGDRARGAGEVRSGGNGGDSQDVGTGSDRGETPSPPLAPARVDTSGPAAVPLPLVALASIAGLLLLLGAAGYLKRRVGERHGGGPPTA
jgi:hypothetical protein